MRRLGRFCAWYQDRGEKIAFGLLVLAMSSFPFVALLAVQGGWGLPLLEGVFVGTCCLLSGHFLLDMLITNFADVFLSDEEDTYGY